jgi:2-oxoglutarate dehydrogenase E1 component
MDISREFAGPNLAYVLELYDRYRENPQAVDAATRAFFAHWTPPAETPEAAVAPTTTVAAPAVAAPVPALEKIAGAVNLARAIRSYGHLAAHLDPLGGEPPGDPALDLATHGLNEEDLAVLPATLVGGPAAQGAANAAEAIARLRALYSGTLGFDFEHIRLAKERGWLREAAESDRYGLGALPVDKPALLDRLTQVEVFEQFLQRVFPGRTRFSIEGMDMLVPVLDEVIGGAAAANICTIFIGMGHRGRLNVLAHVLHKPYAEILSEFRDPVAGHNFIIRDDLGWTGDVKYHKGAQREVNEDDDAVSLVICMPPNPSHLEHVDPVVEGMARAASTDPSQPGPPQFLECTSLPILIHGDAAFSGQGIVAETLNLSKLPAYRTGGTIHIITNNQLGFTTLPGAERSTLYASDLAKGFNIPVVHVNADDPIACLTAARLAFAYRARFGKDFVIDMVGYRRYGHNEGDEPSFTQPLMYAQIGPHPTVRALWAQTLAQQDVTTAAQAAELVKQQTDALQAILEKLAPEEQVIEPQLQPPPSGTARRVKTAVPATQLRQISASLAEAISAVNLNPRLKRVIERRRKALDDKHAADIDWGGAEELALAAILADGVPIRFTGQDSQRGTFNQRHAVYHDVEVGTTLTPLHHIPQACASFEVVNSPLSENAALGFEYGYNIQAPDRLTIWEAQYGDFINGAQAIVDEFIVSGRAKWEQTPSLVLLLPHGYDGQGPDHSSGRLERFLQLTGEINLRIAVPTTAAQYFHLLRRQAALLQSDPLPLVVMTPKSLLRNRASASSLSDLSEGSWQPVIDDSDRRDARDAVRRVILCSGKIGIDLLTAKRHAESPSVAVVRVEQLYSFPQEDVQAVLDGYPQMEELIWVQEEPENMGAWTFVRPILRDMAGGRWPIHYIGRPPSSSPAEGSSALHTVNQEAIIEQAYNMEANVPPRDIAWLKRV